MGPIYYFAYGSNMDKDRMLFRGVKFTGRFWGLMKNWQLVFNKIAHGKEGVGYANVIPKESSEVEGIVYEINEESIKKLDKFEGFPDHYERQILRIELRGNEFLECVVYIANPTKVKEGLKPTKEYLSHLLEGRDFLSPNYVSFLENIQTIG